MVKKNGGRGWGGNVVDTQNLHRGIVGRTQVTTRLIRLCPRISDFYLIASGCSRKIWGKCDRLDLYFQHYWQLGSSGTKDVEQDDRNTATSVKDEEGWTRILAGRTSKSGGSWVAFWK